MTSSRPCLATRSAHRELLTTSQRQTMSTRSSSVKRCLPNASSSVDHVPKSTRPSLRFSLRGQRSYVELLRGGGRAWGRGYEIGRLRQTSLVPRLSLLRAIIPRAWERGYARLVWTIRAGMWAHIPLLLSVMANEPQVRNE